MLKKSFSEDEKIKLIEEFDQNTTQKEDDNNISSCKKKSFHLTCNIHKKKAKAICIESNNSSKFLCMWDLKNNTYSQSTYQIEEISKKSFLEDMFCEGDITEEKFRNKTENILGKVKEKLDLLFEQLKTEVWNKINKELEELQILSLIHI